MALDDFKAYRDSCYERVKSLLSERKVPPSYADVSKMTSDYDHFLIATRSLEDFALKRTDVGRTTHVLYSGLKIFLPLWPQEHNNMGLVPYWPPFVNGRDFPSKDESYESKIVLEWDSIEYDLFKGIRETFGTEVWPASIGEVAERFMNLQDARIPELDRILIALDDVQSVLETTRERINGGTAIGLEEIARRGIPVTNATTYQRPSPKP
jgi:hypothetical protein